MWTVDISEGIIRICNGGSKNAGAVIEFVVIESGGRGIERMRMKVTVVRRREERKNL